MLFLILTDLYHFNRIRIVGIRNKNAQFARPKPSPESEIRH